MNIDFKENLFESGPEKENRKLFSDDTNKESESDPLKSQISNEKKEYWKVLVVDDEEDIHSVTRMALKGFVYMDKEIKFLNTFSAKETKKVLAEHDDIALIFLDVVMESNDAGLELVKYIRNKLKNNLTQIVLRTGYPGQAPEREVITEYEINDYKTKTELTTFKLFTVTLASLRAYNSMLHLENLRQTLEEKVSERTVELEKKNIRIMEMDQMKTRFFANISHEFRTPLSLIVGPLEEMLLHDRLGEKERDNMEMMYRNAIRLLGLVNQLLDLSKIDAGKLKIELIEYDIYRIISRIVRGFAPMAERKMINYNIDMPKGSLTTFFDHDKLDKIITNLLSNAFKFTPEKGNVNISVQLLNDKNYEHIKSVEISVSDSGKGIPPDQTNKIFERFYQVLDLENNKNSGTGIGLSLAKELVTLQYGSISVESNSDEGSHFTVRLPIGKDHLKENEYIILDINEVSEVTLFNKPGNINSQSFNIDKKENIEENNGKPVLLVIDDNDDVRQFISEHLWEDFLIEQATDGKKGWDKAINIIPDLILSDIMMPGLEGDALCAKLKNDERTSHIPIILLTAKADMKNKIEGLETGADDYITKPFNMAELKSRVNNLIKLRKNIQKKYSDRLEVEPSKILVKSADDRFLKHVIETIEKNISDSDFDVNAFVIELNMSRMQLFRKLKALINQSPGELIRNMRLKRAAQLIKQNFGNVAEIAYEVGFNNLSYFAKCFKEKYGVLPSEFGGSRK